MLMYLQMFPFYGFNVFVVRNNDCSGFLLKKKVKQSIWILWRCLMRYDNPIKSKLRWNYNPVYCSRWCLVATLDLEMFWTRLPWKLACFHAPAKFVFSFWSLRTIYAKHWLSCIRVWCMKVPPCTRFYDFSDQLFSVVGRMIFLLQSSVWYQMTARIWVDAYAIKALVLKI